MSNWPLEPDHTYSLVCLRWGEANPGMEDRMVSLGAIGFERWLDHTLAWFTTAKGAVRCAVEIAGLGSSTFRIGVSTADVDSDPSRSRLAEEARAAADLAEIGQVLITLATQELVRDSLGAECVATDLGNRRLATGNLVRLFLLEYGASSRRLEDLVGPAHRRVVTNFVGRHEELSELKAMLVGSRCLSLIGPPGIGKSTLARRLVAELEDDFSDGTAWVDVSGVLRAPMLLHRVAEGLEIKYVQEKTMVRQITRRVGNRNILFVLDGFDNVEESGSEFISDLLSHCPNCSVVTTSIRRISAPEASAFPLQGLDFPAPFERPEGMASYDAVRFYLDCALVEDPHFTLDETNGADVAMAIALVEGSPWAIQMIASRAGVLTPRQILTRLKDDPLALLHDKAVDKGIKSALSAVVSTLNPWSLALFARLSVFKASFTLEAAEKVCAASDLPASAIGACLRDLLEARLLFRCGIVNFQRSFALGQICRELAASRLVAEDRRKSQKRLSNYVDAKVESLAKVGLGSDSQTLEEFETIYEELRSLWLKNMKREDLAVPTVDQIVRCANFWFQKNYYSEGLEIATRASHEPMAANATRFLGLLNLQAWCHLRLGDLKKAKQVIAIAVRHSYEQDKPFERARLLNTRAGIASEAGRLRTAARCYRESIKLLSPGDSAVETILVNLGPTLSELGKTDEAGLVYQQVEILRRGKSDWFDTTFYSNRASFWEEIGLYEKALGDLESTCEACEKYPNTPVLISAMMTLASIFINQGRLFEARVLSDATLAVVDFYSIELNPARVAKLQRIDFKAGPPSPTLPEKWDPSNPLAILRFYTLNYR